MATRKKKTGHKTTRRRKPRKKTAGGSVKTQIDHVIKSLQTIKKHV